MNESVKIFWDARAKEYGLDPAATLTDQYLRMLEIEAILKRIKDRKPDTVLDVGCGNGFSTICFAKRFPETKFIGLDYSEEMIRIAYSHELSNCKFVIGDVLKSDTLPDLCFDMIITQRCIQNILSYDLQFEAITNLLRKKTFGGIMFLMECSQNGAEMFNRLSHFVNPKRNVKKAPFHNLWLQDECLVRDFNARIEYFCSTYMLAKSVHERLRYLGYRLPQIGRFGYEKIFVIE